MCFVAYLIARDSRTRDRGARAIESCPPLIHERRWIFEARHRYLFRSSSSRDGLEIMRMGLPCKEIHVVAPTSTNLENGVNNERKTRGNLIGKIIFK